MQLSGTPLGCKRCQRDFTHKSGLDLRIGFICAPSQIIQRLVIAKQVADCHTNVFFQIVTEQFLSHYDVDAHVEKIRNIYRERCDLMLKVMNTSFDKSVSYKRPDGGLFLWCTLPQEADSMQLAKLAVTHNVAFVPGCCFMVDDTKPCASFRLNYSTPSREDITCGISQLGQAIDEYLKKENRR